jgi:TPR repeat protein
MYEYGQGVPQDYAEAVKWFRKAADQGYASALSNLGRMYTWRRGVPQDYVVAHMWFDLATSSFVMDPPESGRPCRFFGRFAVE